MLTGFACAAERYKDRMFDVEKKKDVSVATGVPFLSSYHAITTALMLYSLKEKDATIAYFYTTETDTKDQDLKMDLYTPKGDKETDRAVVIVNHGGAMVAGSKNDYAQHTVNYCDSLAARGYVTASLEYRLGVTVTEKDYQLHIDSADFARAVYRGVQDVRATVRYFRANAEKLGINPNRIYLVGNSAGAIISLENIYSSTEEDFPKYVNYKGVPDLGALDSYGEQGFDSRANAAASLWGAVHNLDMIGDNDTPVLLIHGTGDGTVSFKTARPLSNVAAVLENIIPSSLGAMAASYTLDLNAPTLYGSYVIDSLLTKKNIAHETYFVEGMGHEFYDDEKYTATVQKKVFDFLYNQTQTPVAIPALVYARPAGIHMGERNMSFTVGQGIGLQYAVRDIRGNVVQNGRVTAGEMVDLSSLHDGAFVVQVKGERSVRFNLVH